MKTSVSFLGSLDSIKTITKIEKSNADFIHIDVADGMFVNNSTPFSKDLMYVLKNSEKPKEVHLMTFHLKQFIDAFSFINPECIIFEYESTIHHEKIIKYIRDKKIKVGIAIGPLTDLKEILPFIKKVDIVLLMSIIPGYGGQSFLKETEDRIHQLSKIKKEKKATFEISVDGGINEETIQNIKNDLDRVVAGSFIYKNGNYDQQLDKLK